jgi:monovalent cation:proton antiporter-2 (CPA2) family protein
MTNFITQFLIFIGASLFFVPLFKKFGFGSVLGYLMAGVIVGPYGVGLINDAESVLHFAEFGVVLLLFMIGLEVQPHKLRSMGKQLVWLGGFQILYTTLIFCLIGLIFNIELVPALVLGFGLSLSSTAFAVQSLEEKNQLNTEFGQASFSVLLMQDLIAIPALALIPVLGNHSFQAQVLLRPLLSLVVLIFILLIVRSYFIKPLFRFIAATRAREMFTALTLFIVFGIAAIMQKIGLSAALGTFLAGVLLAESEYRHELETNLDPFKGLLMGLFFIAVGMGVKLPLIAEQPLFILGATFLYLIIKGLILYLVGRQFKMNHENAKLLSCSVSQGGEFAFVILGIVLRQNISTPAIVETLTVIITLSMALSPVISKINEHIRNRYLKKSDEVPNYDDVSGLEPKVIIAGFGRFGQMFGRVLKLQGIPFVAIDHDPDNIEIIRKFGNKVFYGDASRVDLLESAGAKTATHFILAIDDVETSIETAKNVKEHFPHIHIFARARNRGHTFRLMDEGIKYIKRETIDSSLNFVGELLIDLGFEKSVSKNIVERFRTHDEAMLHEQFKVHSDDKNFVSVTTESIAQLAQVIEDERKQSYIASRED